MIIFIIHTHTNRDPSYLNEYLEQSQFCLLVPLRASYGSVDTRIECFVESFHTVCDQRRACLEKNSNLHRKTGIIVLHLIRKRALFKEYIGFVKEDGAMQIVLKYQGIVGCIIPRDVPTPETGH